MRSNSIFALAAATAAANALPELSISKRDANLQTSPIARGLVRRAGSGTVGTNVFDILAYSSGGAYYANVTVGTPPQNQVVILDTGSSDLYFDASTAQTCETPGPNTCKGGTFNSDDSSTYSVVDESPAFNTSFGDGSTALGPFGEDIIGIGDVTIDNVQFGVAKEVNSTTGYAIGLMGVGYSLNEATLHPYPNMPEVLRDTGVINSRLYSIYLNDVGEISGSILFGGIDTSKYTGELVTLDILPDPEYHQVFEFISTVTALSAKISGTTTPIFSGGVNTPHAFGSYSDTLPVLLDTGSAAWSIPTEQYNEYIAPNFPYVDSQGSCDCSHRDDDTSLTLEFGGKINITVPIRELLIPLYNATTNEPYAYDTADSTACAFMLNPAEADGSGFQTLGDSILRSMYVVFDLDNGQLSLAQAAVNSTAPPNIVTVQPGKQGVASAVVSASGVTYVSAPANTASIAPVVHNATMTSKFVVSTAQSTIGVATGTAAVPADAQVSASTGTAGGLLVPGVEFGGLWTAGVSLGMVVLGMGALL